MFKTTLYPEPAVTRCYECGSKDIVAICHHCGRAMDEMHSKANQASLAGVVVREFTGLNLSGQKGFEGNAEHCSNCNHQRRKGDRLLIIGLLIFFLGITGIYILNQNSGFSFNWMSLAMIGILFLGVAFAVTAVHRLMTTGPMAGVGLPPLPVVSKRISADITETIEGRISLTPERSYTAKVERVSGQANIFYIGNPKDQPKRFSAYMARHKITSDQNIRAHFGYVQLNGSGDIAPDGSSAFLEKCANTFEVVEEAEKLTFLKDSNASIKQSTFVFRQQYTIQKRENNNGDWLPVIIQPVILGEETHRTLQLLIYFQLNEWNRHAFLEIDRVELLDINVPNELGRIVSTDPAGFIEQRADKKATGVFWKNFPWRYNDGLTPENENKSSENESKAMEEGVYVLPFNFSVDKDIDAKGDTVLHGKLRLRLKGLYSGISGATFYSALGKKLHSHKDVSLGTNIDIHFDLSLAALLTPKVHILKKEIYDNDISPDYLTVGNIIRQLNENEIVVGHVTESAPHTGRGGLKVLYRRWDISGHYFEGLWPLKFNLTITGQQSAMIPGALPSGHTKIEVTVRSNYHEDAMQQIIENFFMNLLDHVKSALAHLNCSPSSDEHANPSDTPDEKLQKLDEALLNGRISEEVYKEIKSRILA